MTLNVRYKYFVNMVFSLLNVQSVNNVIENVMMVIITWEIREGGKYQPSGDGGWGHSLTTCNAANACNAALPAIRNT